MCLASRFSNQDNFFHTFSLITISFILFALWPEYRRYLQVYRYCPSYCLPFFDSLSLFLKIAKVLTWNSLAVNLSLFDLCRNASQLETLVVHIYLRSYICHYHVYMSGNFDEATRTQKVNTNTWFISCLFLVVEID